MKSFIKIFKKENEFYWMEERKRRNKEEGRQDKKTVFTFTLTFNKQQNS